MPTLTQTATPHTTGPLGLRLKYSRRKIILQKQEFASASHCQTHAFNGFQVVTSQQKVQVILPLLKRLKNSHYSDNQAGV